MPKISIELDLSIIKDLLKVKTQDAAEDVLRRYDLQMMIEKAITSDERPKKTTRDLGWTMLYSSEPPQSPREWFEKTVQTVIKTTVTNVAQAAAEDFLKKNPQIISKAVESALPRMTAALKLKIVTDDDDD